MSRRKKSEVDNKNESEVEYLSKKLQTLKVISVRRETTVKYLIDQEKSMGSAPKNKNQRNDTQKTKSTPETFHRNKGSDGNRNPNSSTHRPPTCNQPEHYNSRKAHYSQKPNASQYVHIHNQNRGSNVDIVISHSDKPINRPYPYRHDGPSGSHHRSSNAQNQYGIPNVNRFPHPQSNQHSNHPPSANFNFQKPRNVNPPRNQNQSHQQFNPPRNQNQHHQQFTGQASNKATPITQYRPQWKYNTVNKTLNLNM